MKFVTLKPACDEIFITIACSQLAQQLSQPARLAASPDALSH
jgi:hypothetical protein